jgi:poly(A) polymerase
MTNRQAAIDVVKRLQREGYQALLAGGCVRDMLLGRRPKDYDVATNARPEEVMALFPRTLEIGAKFGVVIVLAQPKPVEVATFRTETGYQDGRHPETVTFTNAAEDAGRRDFTINGMFYDPLQEEVLDFVDGQADLDRRIIRTIGSADERFGEDYLRMLRAVRFSTELDFPIEPKTFAAIKANAPRITAISGERIAIELETTLTHPNRGQGAALLFDSGLVDAVFPDLRAGQHGRVVEVLGRLRKRVDFALALAALFADCEAETALAQCRILKPSRDRIKHLRFLLAHRGRLLDDDMSLASLKKLLAQPYYLDLYELERATQKADGNNEALVSLGRLHRRVRTLRGVDVKPRPLLNGHDLIRLGAAPGPTVGQLAEELYIAQLEGHLHTNKQAQQWAGAWLARHRAAGK